MRFLLALLCLSLSVSASAAQTLLVFGDSLSAGYGLDANAGWVSLLARRIGEQRLPYEVVNASVSGETTAGGLARLPAALERFQPAIVLIELGGNDGLRGQPPAAMRANLDRMIELSRGAGAQPVLFQMRIPSNYGPEYAQRFTAVFDALAQSRQVPLVPFFLAGIAADRARWFQDDGIHPRAEAQPQMLEAVWPVVRPLLK
jgi:acyl-CoA thioesterase-1